MNTFFLENWFIANQFAYIEAILVMGIIILLGINYLAYRRIILPLIRLSNDVLVKSFRKKPWFVFSGVCLANLAMMFSLLLLILPLEVLDEEQKAISLYTYGATKEQLLEHLTQGNKSKTPDTLTGSKTQKNVDKIYLTHAFVSQHNIKATDKIFSNSTALITVIKSAEQLASLSEPSEQLQIVGDGLSQSQLSHFSGRNITFFPSTQRAGIVEPSWQRTLLLGQSLVFSGKYHHTDSAQIVDISLVDSFDKTIITQKVKAGERFVLKSQPKTHGQYNYKLRVHNNQQKLLNEEIVAFSVETSLPISMLIKQSSPSFETKFLQNWASQQGASVFIQTQISKDRFISQKLNMKGEFDVSADKTGKIGISINLLNQFDVLVIDGRSLLGLSEKERGLLNNAIYDGLGVIIQTDSALLEELLDKPNYRQDGLPFTHNILQNFELRAIETRNNKLTSQVRWKNGVAQHPLGYFKVKLNIEQGQDFAVGDDLQPLVGNKKIGAGNVSITLVNSTHEWLTQGEPLNYSKFWQAMFQQVARNSGKSYWLKQKDKKSLYVGAQFQVCARLQNDGVYSPTVHLVPTLDQNDVSCGEYWPNKAGWQTLSLMIKTPVSGMDSMPDNENLQHIRTQHRYAYLSSAWAIDQQNEKHIATTMAQTNKSTEEHSSYRKTVETRPLDKTIIWWIFLISGSFLWIERKLAH